jgi:hypothetical protein
MERAGVVNNIPHILGEIGYVCNELKLPPLSCLIVNKSTGKCGKGVVTSKEVPVDERSEFTEKIDRPNVCNCQNYPRIGTMEANDFLIRVMNRLRKRGMTNE